MRIVDGWIDVALDPINAYSYKSMSREGHKPTGLVYHETGGGSSAQGVATWFSTPLANGGTAASAHIIVDRSGTVVQGINLNDAAWSNGGVTAGHASFIDPLINPNFYTISIEFVTQSLDNSLPLADIQYDIGASLTRLICDYYGIPKRRAIDKSGGLYGHRDFDPVNRPNCPGSKFDWGRMIALTNPPPSTTNRDRALREQWHSTAHIFGGTPPSYGSGIASAWRQLRIAGKWPGPPITREYQSVMWDGRAIIVQEFANARCEWWDNTAHWHGLGI